MIHGRQPQMLGQALIKRLQSRWEAMVKDARDEAMPMKEELDLDGTVTGIPKARVRSALAGELFRLLLQHSGKGVCETPAVVTWVGIRVPDVAWFSARRKTAAFPRRRSSALLAPEICVEVVYEPCLLAGAQKRNEALFLAGAEECWLCDADGRLTFFDAHGPLERSHRAPEFPSFIEIDRTGCEEEKE
jgi:hypothetical protein